MVIVVNFILSCNNLKSFRRSRRRKDRDKNNKNKIKKKQITRRKDRKADRKFRRLKESYLVGFWIYFE